MYPWLLEHCVYLHAIVNIGLSEEYEPVTMTSDGDLKCIFMRSQLVISDTFVVVLFHSMSRPAKTVHWKDQVSATSKITRSYGEIKYEVKFMDEYQRMEPYNALS